MSALMDIELLRNLAASRVDVLRRDEIVATARCDYIARIHSRSLREVARTDKYSRSTGPAEPSVGERSNRRGIDEEPEENHWCIGAVGVTPSRELFLDRKSVV